MNFNYVGKPVKQFKRFNIEQHLCLSHKVKAYEPIAEKKICNIATCYYFVLKRAVYV